MLDNSIRGGQIFIHHIRMFKQIASYAMLLSCFCGFIIATFLNIERFQSIKWYPALTYLQGFVIDKFDDVVPSLIGSSRQMHINIAKEFGAANLIPIKKFMKISYFKYHGQKLFELIVIFLSHSGAASLGVFLIIFCSFRKFGKFAKEARRLGEDKIHTAKSTNAYLRTNNIASDISIGNMPLVRNSETKHILITGSTGSGKSNCLHILLPQIRRRCQPAIVIDTEGTMVERYYRPGKDIILNPFDSRSHSWDLWQEIDNDLLAEKVAVSFFPEAHDESYNRDKIWSRWGEMLFLGAIEYLKKADNKTGSKTIKALFDLLHRDSLETLTKKIKHTSFSGLFDDKSGHNPAPHNIRMNAIAATKWLRYFTSPKKESVSFRKWFGELDSINDDRWIFITSDTGDSEFLLQFFSTVMDIALNSLTSLKVDSRRRVWFVMDELAKLKYMPALEKNITLLRKYGGCILAATQSFRQLFDHYGKNSGSIMISQFNTNIIFKILDKDDADVIAKRVGSIEVMTQQKNTSYGAHEHRDGISYTEQLKNKYLIEASDIAKLKPGEAYVLLPEPMVFITKIKTPIAVLPKNMQPSFMGDMNMELFLQSQGELSNEEQNAPKETQAKRQKPKQKKGQAQRLDKDKKIIQDAKESGKASGSGKPKTDKQTKKAEAMDGQSAKSSKKLKQKLAQALRDRVWKNKGSIFGEFSEKDIN